MILFFFIHVYSTNMIFYNVISTYEFLTFYYYTFGFVNILTLFILSKVIFYINTKNILNMCI